MEELEKLAKQIKNKRLESNISMNDVAKQADITRATLFEIEKGNPKCAIGSYFKVMSILGIDFEIQNNIIDNSRERATRRILLKDKKINSFIVLCIESYASYLNKSTNVVFEKMQKAGLIDHLYDDYEDMHGMSNEYLNDYFDKYLIGENSL